MARKFKVEGKSIQQLTRLRPKTISRMSEPELRKVVTRLASAANKRIARIEAKGITTPATRGAEKSGGRFTSKGKDLNELRAEYIRVKSFLGEETSTISGYKKFAKRFEKKIEQVKTKEQKKENPLTAPVEQPEEAEPEIEQEEPTEDDARYFYDKYDKVWRVVDRLKEKNPWVSEGLTSSVTAMVEEYINNNPDVSVDDASDLLDKHLREWYEQQQERDNNINWSRAF